MASPLSQIPLWVPIIQVVIGLLFYILILKILSSLLKFENRTWKMAAIVTIIFFIMGYLFNRLLSLVELSRWSQLVSLIILVPIVKYLYREKWWKSVLVVIILFFAIILVSFLTMAVVALIVAAVIGAGGGIPVNTLP